MHRLQNLQKKDSVRGAEEFGRKGPQFLTMTRADFAAYEYLCKSAEAKEWIEAIIQEPLNDNDLWKALGNGIALCKVINVMYPGTIPKYNGPGSFSFKLIENIDMFLAACHKLGLPKEDIFSPLDLFEKKNMPLVLNTLYKLAEQAAKQGFQIKWQKKQNMDFTPREIQEAKKLEGVQLWTGSSNTVSDEEKRKRQEAEEKKKEQDRLAQEEFERKRLEQEEARRKAEEEERKRKEAEEEERRRQQEAEEAKKKAEEERRLRELAELEAARKKEKEEYEALKRKLEEEERKRKEEEEAELRRKKQKEEEDEANLAKKYGGASNLDKIRRMLADMEKMLGGEDGNTALHIAADKQMDDVVKYLLEEQHADPNKSNSNHDIPLHIAASKPSGDIVDSLLKAGSNNNSINRDGNSPLHNAAKDGQAKHCQRLLDAGAEVNARNLNLDTPLILATQYKHQDCIDVLTKAKADVNAHNKDEDSALHYAAETGSVAAVNSLYDVGNLDLNPRNKENATPLHVAAEREYFDVVKRLVELGADLNTQKNDGWSPLYTAAYNGDHKTVVLLLSKGADVDGANEEGWTPLHAACAQGHLPVVKTMVEDFNATINILNTQGTTPLFHATSAGRRSIVDFLVSKGADVDMSKEDGWKPIHAACYNEFVKLTTYLVDKGASLSAPCKEIRNYTPLQILISTDEPPMNLINLLVSKGAKLNVKNDTGGTALHLAVFWGHQDVVELLVEEGAAMDEKNDRGRTPLDLAGLYGHKKIAEYLSKKSGVKMPEMQEKKRVTKMMDAPGEPPAPEKFK